MSNLSPFSVIGARPYEEVRADCYAVKDAKGPLDPVMRRCAERIVDGMLPGSCFLVPVPGHYGIATDSCSLAWAVAAEFNRRYRTSGGSAVLCDVLECDPHLSLCEAKHTGVDPEGIDLHFRLRDVPIARLLAERPEVPVFLVDNVVDTGHTVRACLSAISARGVVAVGDTGRLCSRSDS